MEFRSFGEPSNLFSCLRLSVFVAVYLVLGAEVPSDFRDVYYPEVKAALAGGIWNLDFTSAYSPLFPYVGAGLLVAGGPLAFVVLALSLDVLTLWLWNRLVANVDSRAAGDVSLAYAFSAPVILIPLVGTQQIWIGAGLAASISLLMSNRTVASGLLQGLALCTTKILVLRQAKGRAVGSHRRSSRRP